MAFLIWLFATEMKRRQALLSGLVILTLGHPAHSFPPYRSTDADTAGADMLELRVGLLRLEKSNSESERNTPLIRTNFGIRDHFEIVSEFDYSPESERLDEGAVGFKWARIESGFGLGVETLMLLPVQPNHGGIGIESQFLTTLQKPSWQLHMNLGAFRDSRSGAMEDGWRASLLAEFPRDRGTPGIELFAKDTRGDRDSARIQLGAGIITDLELFELRSGIHFGLNDAAPDVEVSIWFAWKWAMASD